MGIRTIIIHPKDPTTDFLSVIYEDKDWTVINTNVSDQTLKNQIESHDRIIMMGHGTEKGLIGFDRYIIDSDWAYILREKQCVYIWCNADKFVEKHNLKGLYTGMIISEYEEAVMYGIPTNSHWIKESNTDLALAIKYSIDNENALQSIKTLYEGNSAVVEFNRNNFYQT